jgi:hypothetical protein
MYTAIFPGLDKPIGNYFRVSANEISISNFGYRGSFDLDQKGRLTGGKVTEMVWKCDAIINCIDWGVSQNPRPLATLSLPDEEIKKLIESLSSLILKEQISVIARPLLVT